MDPSAPKLPPKPIREQAKVLYAYEAQNDDELSIREGDVINVLSKEIEDQGWFKGELNGKVGVFPDNFVELIRVPSASSADHDPVPVAEKPLPPRPGKQITTATSTAQTASPHNNNNKSSARNNENVNGVRSDTSQHSKSGIFANLTKKSSSSKVTSSSTAPPAAVTPSVRPDTSSSLSSSSSSTSSSRAITKPDIIPESTAMTMTMDTSDSNGASDSGQQPASFSDMDVSGSKLSHITATRPKGPSNRRPPSYIALTNAAAPASGRTDGSAADPVPAENGHHASDGAVNANGKVTSPSSSAGKAKEDPPAWMVELRKTQEAKKQGKDSSLPSLTERQSSIDSSEGPASLTSNTRPSASSKPLVTASNRASGDFSNRINQFGAAAAATNSTPVTDPAPVSILKPVKPIKPGVTPTAAVASSPPTSATATTSVSPLKKDVSGSKSAVAASPCPPVSAVSSPAAANSSVVSSSNNSQSTTTSSASPADASPANATIIEMQREIRILKQNLVPKTDYDDLYKQVLELKDVMEQQKQSQGKIVKELINDLAEERKKLAMLTIEVDRLRKLSTTV